MYIERLDATLKNLSKAYFRFVDDIFILCEEKNIEDIWGVIQQIRDELQLKINAEKSTPEKQMWSLQKGFEFLGYCFSENQISVRKSSYDRYVNSLVGKIIKFKHDQKKPKNTDGTEIKKQVFIEVVPENRTGS